jgi:hypothetical protein
VVQDHDIRMVLTNEVEDRRSLARRSHQFEIWFALDRNANKFDHVGVVLGNDYLQRDHRVHRELPSDSLGAHLFKTVRAPTRPWWDFEFFGVSVC